jgi:phage tail-like protein
MNASYRQYLLLAPGPGWRATTAGLTADSTGALRLDPLPGAPAPVAALSALSEERPVALCLSRGRPLHVLCAEHARIYVAASGCKKHAHPLPEIGAGASGERRLRSPRDITLLPDAAIAVADAGDGAIKIFSPFPYALLSVWRNFGRPVRIEATARGDLWILDAESRRVVRADRDGAARETLAGLIAPAEIAVAEGFVAVLDGSDVRCLVRGAIQPVTIGAVPDAACLCVDSNGAIYVGGKTGLIHVFARTPTGWRDAGVGVLGQTAPIHRLVLQADTTLLALVTPEGETHAQVWTMDTQAARVREATLSSEELDSGLANCVWHRIALDADIPDGSSIEVSTETHDVSGGSAPPDLTPAPIVLSGALLDCLVQKGTGRYLTLKLRLRGNGTTTPTLRGVRIWFPRDGWLKALPAVYQEDPESSAFLDRFLSILQTAFEGFDETIDDIWKLFDARSVPDKWFDWLAAWIALPINPRWSDAQRRSVLRNAFQNYRRRSTPAGLEQVVGDYAGVGARVVEHFRLRQWIRLVDDSAKAVSTGAGRLWSRDAYRRWQVGVYSQVGMIKLAASPEPAMEPLAWGANQFSVFFDAAPLNVAETRKNVVEVVEREKPAHTQTYYRPVYARMRIGVQATLGVDTRVGEIGAAVLGRISTLGYDSILACRSQRDAIPTGARATRPRLGIDARLS